MKLVNLEQAQRERIVVERDGQPVSFILSVADCQHWTGMTDEELTALFSRPAGQARLQRADADYAAGRSLSHEEVGARLRARSENDGSTALGAENYETAELIASMPTIGCARDELGGKRAFPSGYYFILTVCL